MRVAAIMVVLIPCLAGPVAAQPPAVNEDEAKFAKQVYESIDRGRRWLIKQQRAEGAWRGAGEEYRTGFTCLALMALINCGMTPRDAVIERGLKFLRNTEEPSFVYETSLMLMTFALAKDGKTDIARMTRLVEQLEGSQVKSGPEKGLWGYSSKTTTQTQGDPSNGQFAVLALREAQEVGVPVELETWQRAREYWASNQMNGGWRYHERPIGSMTVAGISTMVITEAMVRWPDAEQDKIDCCAPPVPDMAVEKGVRWLADRFSVQRNPDTHNWLLYYLYGLERAGRLSGRRFIGEHDWYREGSAFLVKYQQAAGNWESSGSEATIVGSSFALLFLSKGLSPVLINKLQYGPADNVGNVAGLDWNNHRDDARNLTQFITSQDKWPRLLTWQLVELPRATLGHLQQAPVLLLNGRESPQMTEAEAQLLRSYVDQGGFIFAEASCHSEEFDRGFRELVTKMYPNGEAKLAKLTPEHPVYRSEYLIDPGKDSEFMELWGVDTGCRTGIIYSPKNDLCGLWDHWTSFPLPKRSLGTTDRITKGVHMGVNLVAYATGREIPDKLKPRELADKNGSQDQIERGLIQIAKIRYTGDWDAAPQALRSLLLALNRTAGMVASTKQKSLLAQDAAIFKYPMLYLHGRNNFDLSAKERENLKLYLQRGNVLFADSCCSAPQFDKAFRRIVQQMFPNNPLKRIPVDHEMFKLTVGYDLQRVKRREPNTDQRSNALSVTIVEGPPHLEGIEIDGRFVLIYSPYDISCALEKQSSVACTGYVHEDAVRIAVNVVLYAMLQ